MWMSHRRFCDLVVEALDDLPDWVHAVLDNVAVVVDDWPTRDQLEVGGGVGRGDLLGLYEGVPQTDRTTDYGLVAPDKITVFRGPILGITRTDDEVRREVQHTVLHELAHHFGIDDDRLLDIDAY